MGVAALWPDGELYRADTWDELLERVRQHPWNAHLSSAQFRRALAKRAWVWSMTYVDPEAPAHELVAQLEDAGLLRVVHLTEKK